MESRKNKKPEKTIININRELHETLFKAKTDLKLLSVDEVLNYFLEDSKKFKAYCELQEEIKRFLEVRV